MWLFYLLVICTVFLLVPRYWEYAGLSAATDTVISVFLLIPPFYPAARAFYGPLHHGVMAYPTCQCRSINVQVAALTFDTIDLADIFRR